MVGAIGAVIDFGTFNLLRGGVGMLDEIAQSISFLAAVTSNFLWNRYWTYPDSRSKPIGRQASQFFIVNVIGLTIRTAVFWLIKPTMIALAGDLLDTFGDTSASQAVGLGVNLALMVAVIVVLFWNFGVNRVWTYSDVQ